MKTFFSAALLGAALMVSGAVNAAVLSTTGNIVQIMTPTLVNNAAPNSNANMLMFNEVQNAVLHTAVTTSNGIIAAGTRVSSYMVLLNHVKASDRTVLNLSGTATFDSAILGLITTVADLNASDAILGAVGTTYATFNMRGLEDLEAVSYLGDTATLTLNVTQPGDWMRIVTISTVPVPAAGFLLFGALGGLAALRRRKSLAA